MVQMKWTAGSNKVHYEMKAYIRGKVYAAMSAKATAKKLSATFDAG